MPVLLKTNKGRKELFDEVVDNVYFKGVDISTVYVLAAVYGWIAGNREELGVSEWVTRHEYISRNTDLLRMCESIAIASTNSIEIMSDEDEIFKIVEEFANAGIIELHNRITKEGEADFIFELQLQLQKFSKNF